MLSNFLHNDLVDNSLNQEVTRIDGLLSGLLGLYCYDKSIKNKELLIVNYLQNAIEEITKLYPRSNEESIKKYYKNVRNKIKEQWDVYSYPD